MVSTIGVVSLSSGIIGEDFVKHEVDSVSYTHLTLPTKA